MANKRENTSSRRARRTGAAGRLPWVSELQLDAYLEAREALRRAHAAALMTSVERPAKPRTSTS